MTNKIATFTVYFDEEIYRTIEINAEDSLFDLASAITQSYEFDFDEAFGFYENLEDISKSKEIYELYADMPDEEPEENVKGVKNEKISSVFTEEKEMAFVYDYDDEWLFLVQCNGFADAEAGKEYPQIIESVGDAPDQYEMYDEMLEGFEEEEI